MHLFQQIGAKSRCPDLLELLVVKVVERVVGVECRAPKAGALPSHTASVHPGGHGEEKPNPGAGGPGLHHAYHRV
jgi:hypothetical protein